MEGEGLLCLALATLSSLRAPDPNLQKACWVPWPKWMGAEKIKHLVPTGNRTPNRAARSDLLYRRRHSGCPFHHL